MNPLRRLTAWLDAHPVASWMIPTVAFFVTGAALAYFHGLNGINIGCCVFAIICGANALDEHEGA